MPTKINWDDLLHDNYSTLKDMIIGHHYQEMMTIEMMADHFGVCSSALKVQIKRLGIIMKQRYGKKFSRNPALRSIRG
jgi:hypothetical protein